MVALHGAEEESVRSLKENQRVILLEGKCGVRKGRKTEVYYIIMKSVVFNL